MKEFSCKTRIVYGHNAMSALKELKARKLLVVTDPYFAENGTAQKVAQISGAEEFKIFRDVTPDPTVSLAASGTALVNEFQPDVVVALGGGSTMDCAKAMVYFSGRDVRFVAIPTTSGSGSEVTDFAILAHEGVKHPLVDPKLAPEIAILEESVLQDMPKSLVADSGFDVIAHAVEAYVGTKASPVTEALAKEAFCAVFGALPASFAGKKEHRLRVHIAATMAGMAFTQAGLGMCHAISHVLGGMYHVPHGRLNAILLPAVIGCNAHAAAEKYASLARWAGLGGSADTIAVRNLKNALVRLRKELQLPDTLAQAGVAPVRLQQDMGKIVQAVLKDSCCETNPLGVEGFMVQKVLEEVMGRV